MRPLGVLYHIPLSARSWGGIQVQFAAFLEATRADRRFRHFLSLDRRTASPEIGDIFEALAAPPIDPRILHGVALPKWLRQRREIAAARRWGVDVVLNVNLPGDLRAVRTARDIGAAAVYWERGAVWFGREKGVTPLFREGHHLFVGNSHASRRMLQDVWGIEAPIEILSPCVWNAPLVASPRALDPNRPLRLGFAARLRAFKGGVLAVHTLAELAARGIAAELLVAGEGPDRERMEAAAERCGVGQRVRFLGRVREMADFYGRIDLLLHPALREPFGIICFEAAGFGVPSVATAVDGLPEAMVDGVSGLCVAPDLPLSRLTGFGGDVADVYPLVYRPPSDDVGAPTLPDPGALAQAVLRIAGDRDRYAHFSRGALSVARTHARPDPHIQRFHDLMRLAVDRR